jgi:chromosome segregation ATPase
MKRAALLVLAVLTAFVVAACGSEEPDDSAALEEALTEARETAEEANEAVSDLETRVDDLVADLDRLDAQGRNFSDKFDRIHKDLRDSIANLRESLSGARSDASEARSTADSALGEVNASLERLSVLENRFDYHLRNDH